MHKTRAKWSFCLTVITEKRSKGALCQTFIVCNCQELNKLFYALFLCWQRCQFLDSGLSKSVWGVVKSSCEDALSGGRKLMAYYIWKQLKSAFAWAYISYTELKDCLLTCQSITGVKLGYSKFDLKRINFHLQAVFYSSANILLWKWSI